MKHIWFGFFFALSLAFAITLTSGETQRALMVMMLCASAAVILTVAVIWYQERAAARMAAQARARGEAHERRLRQIDRENLDRGAP